MDKKGNVAITVLIILVVIVVTSAAVLLLIKTDIISVSEKPQEEILNTQYLPGQREGKLVVEKFEFCSAVGELYDCFLPREEFTYGEEIFFLFTVESSTYQNEVQLVENYRVLDPLGTAVLEVDAADNFYFDTKSSKSTEQVVMKDSFIIHGGLAGEYRLELVLENPLLQKKTTVAKKFSIVGVEGEE